MINENDGRWYHFGPLRPRVDVYGQPRPPAVQPLLEAAIKTRNTRRVAHRRLSSLRMSPPARLINRFGERHYSIRDMHPTTAVTSIFVGGFTFIILIAATLSPSLRHSIPTTPLIAAVSAPIQNAVAAITNTPAPTKVSNSTIPNGASKNVPSTVALLYQSAARTCDMPWQVLAAVGRVETNHGQSDAAGVHSGANFAGAEGPMQFMPATWAKYGVDANKDGHKDIYNQDDAVYSAANYLCANGARNNADMHNALIHYNHDEAYVAEVLSTAAGYISDAYALPISPKDAAKVNFGRPHHDYSADDIAMPVGTQVFAVRGGTVRVSSSSACGNTVEISGTDGYRYTYCHAQSIQVGNGATVNTGDPILKSGGAPGAPGAGDSTGPHLHLQISEAGANVCPQSLLAAWGAGTYMTPSQSPTSGCSY